MTNLSESQRALDPEVAEMLRNAGIGRVQRELLEFEAPFYDPAEPEPVVRFTGNGVTVSLFEDTATFDLPGTSEYFELADYNDVNQFAAGVIHSLRKALASLAA